MIDEKVAESEKYLNQICRLKLALVEQESKVQELTFELDLQKMAYENLEKSILSLKQLVY